MNGGMNYGGIRTANVAGWRLASLNHTRTSDRHVRWWGPNNGDYFAELERAGVYDLDRLLERPWYYGDATLLVVPDYVAQRLAFASAYKVKNTAATWHVFGLVALFRHPHPLPAPFPCKAGRLLLGGR